MQPLQRILSSLSQRLAVTDAEEEVSDSLSALLHLLQSEDVRDTVLSNSGDASLVEVSRDLISGLSKAVRLPSTSIGLTAVAVFDAVCQNEKARQLLLQHSDTEPIFERIPQLLADMPEHSSIPLSVANLTRYPSAQRRVLASGRCAMLLAGLNKLMLCSDAHMASDAACAVGNIAFNGEGRYQVIAYKNLDDVVAGLTHILQLPEELAGNSAWAIGNLCRDRKWCGKMLENTDFVDEVIKGIALLVSSTDDQTACDWACCVAMMTALAQGQKAILDHSDSGTIIVWLLHNAASANTLVQHSACLALRNLKQTKEGTERYKHAINLLVADARPFEMIDSVIESANYDIGANASITLRGLPSTASEPPIVAGNGLLACSLAVEGENIAAVRQDQVYIKSSDGVMLRLLPITMFTEESVIQDVRVPKVVQHATEFWRPPIPDIRYLPGSGKFGDGSDIANGSTQIATAHRKFGTGAKKRDRSDLDEDTEPAEAPVAAVNVSSSRDVAGGASKGGAESDGWGPAPPGHIIKEVVLEKCDESSLSVSWEPVFPESTDSCRFVCDGGNGGSYRNVCTLTREEMSAEGKYYCDINDLLPGREYRVLAIARTRFKPCHGAQTMFDTKALLRTKAAVPTAPEKCVLSSRTRTSLKIRWVAPDGSGLGLAGFEVAWCRAILEEEAAGGVSGEGGGGGYKEDGEWTGVQENMSSKDTSWNMKKLGPGQHYGFRVRAVNTEGTGPWSHVAFYSTAASVPSAPENIKNARQEGEEAVAGKVMLEWGTPSCNGSQILAYVLEQQDKVRGGTFEVVYNGPETRFMVGGLMAGTTYRFRVKASNIVGAGEYSPVLDAAGVAAVPAICDAPMLVKAKATALSLKWNEPDCRGSEVRAYRVLLAEAGKDVEPTKRTKFEKVWQGGERTCELCSGLSAGMRYFLRVVAINSVGESDPGAVAVMETMPDVPPAPQGLTLVSKGNLTAKLRWKSPATLGAGVTGYRIDLEQTGDGSVRTINVMGNVCEYELTELQSERAYLVRVRASNKVGSSSQSEPLRLSPALSPPPPLGAPRLIVAKPNALSVRWDPPGSGFFVEGFRVEVVPEAAVGATPELYTYKVDECRADLTGLRPGVSYKVRVLARNKSGFGEKGAVAVLRTEAVTPAPTNLQTQIIEADNSLIAMCHWDRSEGVSGVPSGAIAYHVEVDDGGEGSAEFKEVYVGANAQFSHQLQNGKSYKFRVRAVSSIGSSAWSVIKGFSRALSGHGTPEGVAARLLDDGRTACLVWNLGINVGAYQVRVDLQEGKKRRLDEGCDYRRSDLTDGPHRFQVRAMINGKWSEWSREVLVTIPGNASNPTHHGHISNEAAVSVYGDEGGSKMVGGIEEPGLETGMGEGLFEIESNGWPGQGVGSLRTHSHPHLQSYSTDDSFVIGVEGAGGMRGVHGVGDHTLFGGGEQNVIDDLFGIGPGVQAQQGQLLRGSRPLYSTDVPLANDSIRAHLVKPHERYAIESTNTHTRIPDVNAVSAKSMQVGVRTLGGGVGVGFGVGGGGGLQCSQQVPHQILQSQKIPHLQHDFGAQMCSFAGGESSSAMSKLLGSSALSGLLGEEEGDELMSSIPSGLLDEVCE